MPEMAIDALLVTYDSENHILLVGRKLPSQSVHIVNAFRDEDADYIYKRLLLKKADDEHSES